MMADTAGLPWLRPGSLGRAGRRAPRRRPATSPTRATPSGLDPAGLADIAAAVARPRRPRRRRRRRRRHRAAAAYDAAIARATSVAWRGDADGLPRRGAGPPRRRWSGCASRVTLLAPADGTYSLASSDAPLVLTVRNDLPVRRPGAARPAHARQPGAVDLRHRRPDARPGPADDAAGAHPGAAVRRVRGHRAASPRRAAGRWATGSRCRSRAPPTARSPCSSRSAPPALLGAALPAPAGPVRAAPPSRGRRRRRARGPTGALPPTRSPV